MTRLDLREVCQGEKDNWAFHWTMLIELTHHSSSKSISIPKKQKNKTQQLRKIALFTVLNSFKIYILSELHFCVLGIHYTAF